MEAAIFHLTNGTNDWQYKNLTLTELKKIQRWRLRTGTIPIFFDTIYEVIENLYQKGYNATFALPTSMENIPSSYNNQF